ncbi:MAG: GNAT family N-acetyltransferase [Cyanobacteria bacterium P01_E01_bin.43]
MSNVCHVPLSTLTQPLLRTLDALWTDAFGWQPLPDDEEVEVDPAEHLFLLQSEDEARVLATAVVKRFDVTFTGVAYPVQGILNVVAAVKGQGYGQAVMAAVHEWLLSEGHTGMGFTKREVSPFYERCGYQVARDLVERFREDDLDNDAVRPHPDGDEDVLYVNDYGNLIQTILSTPNEFALVPEFW